MKTPSLMLSTAAFLPIALLLSSAAGCGPTGPGDGDGDADAGEEEDPDEEACEHMAEGPAEAVTATDGPSGAPSVSTEHTRFDVTLLDDGAGMYSGSVVYEASEAADYLFYLDVDVPFALHDAGGAAIDLEASDAVTLCTEVAMRHTAELGVGTVEILLGPTAEATVSLVIEEAAHEHEDE